MARWMCHFQLIWALPGRWHLNFGTEEKVWVKGSGTVDQAQEVQRPRILQELRTT